MFEGAIVAKQRHPSVTETRISLLVDHFGMGRAEEQALFGEVVNFKLGFFWSEHVDEVDLLAQEWTSTAPLRMGIARIVPMPPLPEGGPLPFVDAGIAVDHPVDRPFPVHIEHAPLYARIERH